MAHRGITAKTYHGFVISGLLEIFANKPESNFMKMVLFKCDINAQNGLIPKTLRK